MDLAEFLIQYWAECLLALAGAAIALSIRRYLAVRRGVRLLLRRSILESCKTLKSTSADIERQEELEQMADCYKQLNGTKVVANLPKHLEEACQRNSK